MPVLVSDPLPVEFEALLERRRAAGADRHDEVWQGVLHMAPAPHERHAYVQVQLFALLGPPAREAGLRALDSFNLGEPDDYRVPDGGLRRAEPYALYVPTAALVIEVVSPGDATWDKLSFYAAHHVDELLIVDPDIRKFDWLALTDTGAYEPIERSSLIALGPADLAAQIDWPAAEG
jgi:Uma2 family endonuclease